MKTLTKTLTVQKWGTLTREDVPLGALKKGMTRVHVKYAGVGRTDLTAVRGGYLLAPRRPFSPGYDFVGTDENGSRLVGMLPVMGAYREYVDLDSRWCAAVPAEVDDQLAAALPLNYLTALALLDKTTKLKPGATVLVHGAGGGVGRALLELARGRGLEIYGLASPERAEELRVLGAVPLNRHGDWVAEAKRRAPRGFDAVFDAQGLTSFRTSWKLLAKGGMLAAYGFAMDLDGGLSHYLLGLAYLGSKTLYPSGKSVGVCGLPAIIADDLDWYHRSMNTLFAGVIDGSLKPQVQQVFPWDSVEEAHAVIADGRVRGKLLLDFGV